MGIKNMFKGIKLYNDIHNALKEAKKLIDNNKGLVDNIKPIVKRLEEDFDNLTYYLPQFKPIIKSFLEIVKKVF